MPGKPGELNMQLHVKKIRRTVTVWIIICFLFQIEFIPLISQNEDEIARQFLKAKEQYIEKQYPDARSRLERIIAVISEKGMERNDILGKCYLLLGALCEMENENTLAEKYYKQALEDYAASKVEDIDLEGFSLYRKIIKGEVEKPEIKVIEQPVKVPPKKRKFPWLLTAGGIVVIGIVALLTLKSKKAPAITNYDTQVLGINWQEVPEGVFEMGDHYNEGNIDELPVHEVSLSTYLISQYEITFAQYDKFIADTKRNRPSDNGWGGENRPVINVSWEDANAFCVWLSSKCGKNIHLPTEAQWEKAARGTDGRRFPWGAAIPTCDITNFNHCRASTQPIGSFANDISPYNVYDMGGNVFEWCQDWYSENYYSSSTYKDPTGPSTGTKRIHRGGCWASDFRDSRAADRSAELPTNTSMYLGFRIVKE